MLVFLYFFVICFYETSKNVQSTMLFRYCITFFFSFFVCYFTWDAQNELYIHISRIVFVFFVSYLSKYPHPHADTQTVKHILHFHFPGVMHRKRRPTVVVACDSPTYDPSAPDQFATQGVPPYPSTYGSVDTLLSTNSDPSPSTSNSISKL